MSNIIEKIRSFVREDEGLTMVEYAVAGSLITATAAAAFVALGNAVENKIDTLTNYVG